MDQLEKSRRKLMSMKLDGKADDKQVQAAAAEQSQIIKQLIVMNSQLETKLYSMLTKDNSESGWSFAPDSQLGRETTAASIATTLLFIQPLLY